MRPLLPVSMIEMPSIMMLSWPPPPMRPPPLGLTPGRRLTRSRNPRLATGSDSSCALWTTSDRSPDAACRMATSALTSTCSVTPPGTNIKVGTATLSPPDTFTSLRSSPLYPDISTVTVYVSAATYAKVKLPSLSVTWGPSLVPWAWLTNITVAPGTTPCASATVPVTVPVVICAEADHAKAKTNPNAAVSLLTVPELNILPPSERQHTETARSRNDSEPRSASTAGRRGRREAPYSVPNLEILRLGRTVVKTDTLLG